MARSFWTSKLWQGILTRLGLVETQQGTLPAAVDYNTIAEIRAETTHVDEDRIQCLENQITYQFETTSTASDDGFAVLKPTDINSGDPGRWLMEFQLALKNHAHTTYANKVAAPAQTKFITSDASGHPVESAYGASSFATSAHNHDSAYATAAVLADIQAEVDALEAIVDDKADKYPVVVGDIGKPAVFDANGNVIPGSTIVFYEYASGALVAGVTKSCVHDKDLAVGYIINVRASDNQNNAMVQILTYTPANPSNSVDIRSAIAIAAPGLIIQILGA